VLTQFRLAIVAAAALGAVWAGQASAFWPFGGGARLSFQPAYGGVCEECDLSGRILTGAKLSNSVFNRANFSRAVMARADASNSQFVQANFTEADLTSASLVRSRCMNAVFRGTLFHGARLAGANFSGADLRRAEGLTRDQLAEACGDHATLLPPGLSISRCEGAAS
jgi:uncharacterized protein YjbI with pentapeptide repeats